MAAAVMAIGAQANDSIATTTVKTDTVVNTKDRKIVVSEDGDMIKVSVFKNDSTGMRMVKETTFTDGQEVEQVYVSSPFLPNTWNARGKKQVQRASARLLLQLRVVERQPPVVRQLKRASHKKHQVIRNRPYAD